jgi:hypothetical protein
MDDLIALLIKTLNAQGAIRVDLTVRITLESRTAARSKHEITCEYCKRFIGSYETEDSAFRARRAHLQHCTAYAEQMHLVNGKPE